MQFNIGEHVLYGKTGVCLIDDIKKCDFLKKDILYYILKPVASKGSTVYVPVDSDLTKDMRPIITEEEIESLLCDAKGKEIEWIEDRQARLELFNSILSEGDRQKIILLIRCLYLKKQEKLLVKKNICIADENILKTAEKLINEEFSFSIGCSEKSVVNYIRFKLGIDK